jgi:hypothetical protein
MGIVIPFERRQEPLPPKKKRSSESILRDYAHTMIAFRAHFIEDEKFVEDQNVDCPSFWPRDIIEVIDPDLDLTISQEQRLANNLMAIHHWSWESAKLETIRDVWRLHDDEAPPPSERAIIAAFKLAGARNERGIAKLAEEAKQNYEAGELDDSR